MNNNSIEQLFSLYRENNFSLPLFENGKPVLNQQLYVLKHIQNPIFSIQENSIYKKEKLSFIYKTKFIEDFINKYLSIFSEDNLRLISQEQDFKLKLKQKEKIEFKNHNFYQDLIQDIEVNKEKILFNFYQDNKVLFKEIFKNPFYYNEFLHVNLSLDLHVSFKHLSNVALLFSFIYSDLYEGLLLKQKNQNLSLKESGLENHLEKLQKNNFSNKLRQESSIYFSNKLELMSDMINFNSISQDKFYINHYLLEESIHNKANYLELSNLNPFKSEIEDVNYIGDEFGLNSRLKPNFVSKIISNIRDKISNETKDGFKSNLSLSLSLSPYSSLFFKNYVYQSLFSKARNIVFQINANKNNETKYFSKQVELNFSSIIKELENIYFNSEIFDKYLANFFLNNNLDQNDAYYQNLRKQCLDNFNIQQLSGAFNFDNLVEFYNRSLSHFIFGSSLKDKINTLNQLQDTRMRILAQIKEKKEIDVSYFELLYSKWLYPYANINGKENQKLNESDNEKITSFVANFFFKENPIFVSNFLKQKVGIKELFLIEVVFTFLVKTIFTLHSSNDFFQYNYIEPIKQYVENIKIKNNIDNETNVEFSNPSIHSFGNNYPYINLLINENITVKDLIKTNNELHLPSEIKNNVETFFKTIFDFNNSNIYIDKNYLFLFIEELLASEEYILENITSKKSSCHIIVFKDFIKDFLSNNIKSKNETNQNLSLNQILFNISSGFDFFDLFPNYFNSISQINATYFYILRDECVNFKANPLLASKILEEGFLVYQAEYIHHYYFLNDLGMPIRLNNIDFNSNKIDEINSLYESKSKPRSNHSVLDLSLGLEACKLGSNFGLKQNPLFSFIKNPLANCFLQSKYVLNGDPLFKDSINDLVSGLINDLGLNNTNSKEERELKQNSKELNNIYSNFMDFIQEFKNIVTEKQDPFLDIVFKRFIVELNLNLISYISKQEIQNSVLVDIVCFLNKEASINGFIKEIKSIFKEVRSENNLFNEKDYPLGLVLFYEFFAKTIYNLNLLLNNLNKENLSLSLSLNLKDLGLDDLNHNIFSNQFEREGFILFFLNPLCFNLLLNLKNLNKTNFELNSKSIFNKDDIVFMLEEVFKIKENTLFGIFKIKNDLIVKEIDFLTTSVLSLVKSLSLSLSLNNSSSSLNLDTNLFNDKKIKDIILSQFYKKTTFIKYFEKDLQSFIYPEMIEFCVEKCPYRLADISLTQEQQIFILKKNKENFKYIKNPTEATVNFYLSLNQNLSLNKNSN